MLASEPYQCPNRQCKIFIFFSGSVSNAPCGFIMLAALAPLHLSSPACSARTSRPLPSYAVAGTSCARATQSVLNVHLSVAFLSYTCLFFVDPTGRP